jgi:dual oxidase
VLLDSTVEELLLGMSSQIAEREDMVLCSDVRDKLFGPMEFSRRDLGALNIMRGRDNGLPDYNTVRYAPLLKISVYFAVCTAFFVKRRCQNSHPVNLLLKNYIFSS